MTKQPKALLVLAVAVATSSCGGSELSVRSIKTPLAEGRQPVDFRVAEGNAQLALGNVGLAIEAYRKALRENPDSVAALAGLATCYDRMGRYDLSRRHYEMALAVAPANTDLYLLFAQSLEAQGQRDEAARVKAELAARVVAPEASREVPGSVPVLPPPPAQSVTVALAPPPSAPVAVASPPPQAPPAVALVAPPAPAPAPVAVLQAPAPIVVPQAPAPKAVALAPQRPAPVAIERPAGPGMRLERLSMREVALITRPEPRWEARTVARTATRTTIRFEKKAQPVVTLLNAARVQGLAARTRSYLAGRGFAGARIGDAPAVRRQSTIVYAPAERVRAERLAAQFGFALERREWARPGVTILLGRDAARELTLRHKA